MDDIAISDFDRAADLASCVAAYVHAFAAPPWEEQWPDTKARDRLLEIADTPGSQFLVAKRRSRVLGLLAGYVESFHPADRFQLAELAVDPGYQRSGIASGLLAELLDRLASTGTVEVFLITEAAGPVHEFWQIQAFVESRGRTVMRRRMS